MREFVQILRDGVSIQRIMGEDFLLVDDSLLQEVARRAFHEIAYYQRPSHLAQLQTVLKDPEASANDRFIATLLLRNAVIASGEVLPFCQDTGTAIILGHKGHRVLTSGNDEHALTHGVRDVYTREFLRYSQVQPLSMCEERNTGNNLPAHIEIESVPGTEYRLYCVAKGGGSANKTMLFCENKALLEKHRLRTFLYEQICKLGTAACPPYHLAVVIGGLTPESTLKYVKLASAGFLEDLPDYPKDGPAEGELLLEQPVRDRYWEHEILQLGRQSGIGAQFGGRYFLHDVRVIRLPRHAASCFVGLGVSCSADRNIEIRINADGVFMEKLEHAPQKYLEGCGTIPILEGIQVDLNQPIAQILSQVAGLPVFSFLQLSGPVIVARDMAHARIRELVENGQEVPSYFCRHPVLYAGPAKKPEDSLCGSIGPTTSQRMDSYVEFFQSRGASLIMLGKGNRSPVVAESCKRYGGCYLGIPGGPAALLASECVKKLELIEFADFGMEAVYRLEVEKLPAFMLCNNRGEHGFAVGAEVPYL